MTGATVPDKVSLPYLRARKRRGQPITMLTAYDHPTAVLQDRAGIHIVFVGDSVGTNLLGYASPQQVTMEDMLHHARAVRRGVERALFVVDMPFMSYQISVQKAVHNAGRLVQQAGAEAVKLEGGREILPQIRAIARCGIPVMGHLGFTPQSGSSPNYVYSDRRGTVPRYQGRDGQSAASILDEALRVEQSGAFALVLELVTEEAARAVAERLSIPVIGIGAGRYCDGQVLTCTDVLGYSGLQLRLARAYAGFRQTAADAFRAYREDVEARRFPGEGHLQHMEPDQLASFQALLQDRAQATLPPRD